MRTLRTYIPLLVCAFLAPTVALAQDNKDGKIKNAAKIVREHVEKIIQQEPQFEQSYGKRVAEQAARDGSGKDYQCNGGSCKGAVEHPWKQSGNPMSQASWNIDTSLVKLYDAENEINEMNNHGCWEFGLLGHSYKASGSDLETYPGPEPIACQAYCLASSLILPWCWPHSPIWADDNGQETAMYWFPEYEASTNNYGVNRFKPEINGQPRFARQALISQKKGNDEQKKVQAGQTYPYDASQFQNPLAKDPFEGQGWAGFYFPDFQEKRYVHIYRSEFSVGKAELKKRTQQGWELDPPFSLLDSFPPKKAEHAIVNIWTEFGIWDLITGIPQLSNQIYPPIGQQIMSALFPPGPIKENARKTPPFWQSQGAMAYRVGKWSDSYGDLKQLYQIQPDNNPFLKESVFKGGYELYPLVSNIEGFGAPVLSSAAIIARRGLYLAGEDKFMQPQYAKLGVPNPRIMQYTIDIGDKSREIDKMQRIRPLKGIKTSECFRSQNIPNMVQKDKSLETWRDQNLPRDLLKYTKENDFETIQGNDVTYMYWNRRITCHCRFCGVVTGSIISPLGGDGDKLYDLRKRPLCTYAPGGAFSAWQGKDTWPDCKIPPEQFLIYRGMNDAF